MTVEATAPENPEPGSRRVIGPGRAFAILLATAFLSLLAYGLFTEAENDDIDQALVRGASAPAPDFDLAVLAPGSAAVAPGPTKALADGRLSLAELRGTPVVLNSWASWCPPCRTEQPDLQRAWSGRRGAAGALFVGLNQQDLTGDARAYLTEFRVGYPQVRDPSDEVSRSFGATGLPETWFIDARGQVVGHVIGAISPQQLAAGAEAARTSRLFGSRAGGDRRTAG